MMVTVFGSNLTDADRENIKKVFSYTSIEDIRIIDVEYEDYDLQQLQYSFVIGKPAIRKVVKSLIDFGVIKRTEFVGNDIIDLEGRFLFVIVPLDPNEIMITEENKDYLWKKVLLIEENINKINELGSEENNGSNEENVDVPFDDPLPDFGSSDTDSESTEGNEANASVTLSIEDFINQMMEKVNLSDAGLGKSLSKFEKVEITTDSGEVVEIYPTTRQPTDSFSFSFKDIVVILKYALLVGGNSITITKK